VAFNQTEITNRFFPAALPAALKASFTFVMTITLNACGGGGVNTEPLGVFNPNPLNNSNATNASPTLVKVLEFSAGKDWAGYPKLAFDALGALQFVAPIPVQSPVGSAEFMYSKKLLGQDWGKPTQLFVASIPGPNADLALSLNASGAAIVGTGFGGTATLKFVAANGTAGTALTRLISMPLGKFSDLSLLADGSAVFSTVEPRSAIDTTLVARINQINAAGATILISPNSEPARNFGSHFFSRSTAEGSLLHFTDPNPLSATNAVLAARAVAAPGLSLQLLNKNNSLEVYSGFATPSCANSEIALTRSPSATGNFAGLIRVLETAGTPQTTRCELKFFKNTTTASTLVYPLAQTNPDAILMSQAAGIQPFIHTDNLDRNTIIWAKALGGFAGISAGVSIELLTVSSTNAISTPFSVAASSATFGTIRAESITHNQNIAGVGALAFLVSEPNAAPGVYVTYVAKYQPGSGFSTLTRVVPAPNSFISGVSTAVNTSGVAVLAATGATCPGLATTTTGLTCTGTSIRSLYTYQF
jgi:hypothetical protein